MNYRKPFIYTCLLSLVAVILITILMKNDSSRLFENATKLPTPKKLPDVNLVDYDGNSVKLSSLKGKWNVLTFGFTNCPDVCPTAMASYKNEIKQLNPEIKDKVQFIFITVDAHRDTSEVLKEYVSFYSKDIKAYSAAEQDLKSLSKALGAHYELAGDLNSDNYEVGHAPYYYILNPKAEWVALYNPPILKGSISSEFNKLSN